MVITLALGARDLQFEPRLEHIKNNLARQVMCACLASHTPPRGSMRICGNSIIKIVCMYNRLVRDYCIAPVGCLE